jgi:uncharacterized membrane protein
VALRFRWLAFLAGLALIVTGLALRGLAGGLLIVGGAAILYFVWIRSGRREL